MGLQAMHQNGIGRKAATPSKSEAELADERTKALRERAEVMRPLWNAVASNNVDEVRRLSKGLDKQAIDDLLFFACCTPTNEATVSAVIESGANVWAKDPAGRTPAHEAAAFGNAGALRALKKAGADLSQPDKYMNTPLMEAVDNGQTDVAVELHHLGVDVGTRNRFNKSALDIAKIRNDKVVIDLLRD